MPPRPPERVPTLHTWRCMCVCVGGWVCVASTTLPLPQDHAHCLGGPRRNEGAPQRLALRTGRQTAGTRRRRRAPLHIRPSGRLASDPMCPGPPPPATSRRRECPETTTSPEVGKSWPETSRIAVLLPAPFVPSRPKVCCAGMPRLRPRRPTLPVA